MEDKVSDYDDDFEDYGDDFDEEEDVLDLLPSTPQHEEPDPDQILTQPQP